MKRVFIIGAGLTKFLPPIISPFEYTTLGQQALSRALRDVNLSYDKIQEAAVSYVYGESCSGQRTLYEIGQSGIPIYNVNNHNCAGSSAIHICYRSIAGGFADCALALGFEKMKKNENKQIYNDRSDPFEPWINRSEGLLKKKGEINQIYSNAALEYMGKTGLKPIHLGSIAQKNHLNSVNNPYSLLKKAYSLNEILSSPTIQDPLTKLQCHPSSNAGAAVILCSERFMLDHNLEDQAVEILSMALLTSNSKDLCTNSFIALAGFDLIKRTAEQVYSQSGINVNEIGLMELDDCCSINELMTYEALGLCEKSQIQEFIEKKLNTYGGKVVINPSGGLTSKGNPMGATGIAQCVEISWHLRGMAEKRQVNSKYALQHNGGLGVCAMMIYKKYNEKKGMKGKNQTQDPEVLEKLEKEEERIFRRNNERESCSVQGC